MKNFEEILQGIPSSGTSYKTRASPMLGSAHTGYSFYNEVEAEENGGIFRTDAQALALPPENTTVDYSISEALMKLSLNDRNAIEEEVHGIVQDTEETPDFLAWCLHEFDKELMKLKNSKSRIRKLEEDGIQDVLKNVIRTTHEFSDLGDDSSCSESTTGTNTPLDTSLNEPIITPTSQSADTANEEFKRSCYVNNSDVRLRFVRAERYVCKKAAQRFVNFLEFGQELYGDFIADRPMQLSDISSRKEKWALSNASFQFLPFRDRSGRRVFVSVGTCGYDIEPKVRIKVLWYMYWIASEDIESQQKGVVFVGWPSDAKLSQSDDDTNSGSETDGTSVDTESNIWEGSLRQNLINLEGVYQVKAFDGLPMRVAALHICFEDRPIYRLLNSLFHFTMNPYLKARYKIHLGEPLEIRYQLQGFGIPTDSFPLTHTMSIKRQNHTQWIALRKRIEHNSRDGNKKTSKAFSVDPGDLVECPRSYDVIIGKAKYKNNPGNVFYRSLIEATHDDHIASSKRKKVELTWRIVRQMEERKGRFLEMNKSVKAFVHIKDRNVMRQKVAQSYKEYKRNAGVIRSKRNLKEPDPEPPKMTIKRQRTVTVPKRIFEKDCFGGCFNGFNCEDDDDILVTPDHQGSDLVVSRSLFTSLW